MRESDMATKFSAGPQALGYLYQCLHPLYLILDSPQETELSIETLDDVVFEEEGQARQLLQLKHHVSNKASLTDSSAELWKTIRVWSEHVAEGLISLPDMLLVLITTAEAPEESIASFLRPVSRNTELAYQRLLAISSETSSNRTLKKAFDAFRCLPQEKQTMLINAIHILDYAPDISETEDIIKRKLELSVRREHLEGLYERLQGWWFEKVINFLTAKTKESIRKHEVQDKIVSIADQFRPEALPIDFLTAEPPTPPDPEGDNRIFVMQLREIAAQSGRIEKAILDYYRAFEQRSRWVREDLLIGDELEAYEKKLVDEWERFLLALQDEHQLDGLDEEGLRHFGLLVYHWVDQLAELRIRPQVTEEYVMRGSYHILADYNPPRVWWHPMFNQRLKQLLAMLRVE